MKKGSGIWALGSGGKPVTSASPFSLRSSVFLPLYSLKPIAYSQSSYIGENFFLRTNFPRPAEPSTLPFSTMTSPRESVIVGQPMT